MSLNVFVFAGNLGKDAEQRYTQGGDSIVSFSVAVGSGYGEKAKTSWVKCSIFGKRGESVLPYLKKGQKVGVSGEFSMNEWTNKDGQKVSTPEVRVNELDLLGSKDKPASQPQSEKSQTGGLADMSDDIPF